MTVSQRRVFIACSWSFLLLIALLEEVALDKTEVHQFTVADRAEAVQLVLGGQRRGRVEQGVGLVVAFTQYGEYDAVPALDEIVLGVALVTQHRIADKDWVYIGDPVLGHKIADIHPVLV